MKTLIVITTSYGDEYNSVIETDSIEELEQFIDNFTEKLSSINYLNFKTNDDCFIIIPKNILDKSIIEFKMVKDYFINDPLKDYSIGDPLGGGYFTGIMNPGQTSKQKYALIVSPKSSGENSLQWKTTSTSTSGTHSLWDGLTNTNNMNNSEHPAAQWCRSLNIDGFTDWYLPAKDELELCYRNFKPTYVINHSSSGSNSNSEPKGNNYNITVPGQSLQDSFKFDGVNIFSNSWYWSSSNRYCYSAWVQHFENGSQLNYPKHRYLNVRAVRRMPL